MIDPSVTSRKTFDLAEGNKLHAERRNPYGFIYVHADKGPVPKILQSAFTSYDEAERAIAIYLNQKQKTVTQVIEK